MGANKWEVKASQKVVCLRLTDWGKQAQGTIMMFMDPGIFLLSRNVCLTQTNLFGNRRGERRQQGKESVLAKLLNSVKTRNYSMLVYDAKPALLYRP